jgi:hypothetical protein
MKPYFADTFYFQDRINPRDEYHERVLAWSRNDRHFQQAGFETVF